VRQAWTPGERLIGAAAEAAPPDGAPTIGVLALQGDVLEHLRALRRCGAAAVQVRTLADLDAVDGLIVPGGESTTIGKLLDRFGLLDPLRERIRDGLPVFGTCAGMILLSTELDQDKPQPLLRVLDVRTRRNAFGRQVDSFDTRVEVAGIDGGPLDVSFIRAPRGENPAAPSTFAMRGFSRGEIMVLRDGIWLGPTVTVNVVDHGFDDPMDAKPRADVEATDSITEFRPPLPHPPPPSSSDELERALDTEQVYRAATSGSGRISAAPPCTPTCAPATSRSVRTSASC
jgi:pyridoxal 5'-phosphate synthase pdxT subunit